MLKSFVFSLQFLKNVTEKPVSIHTFPELHSLILNTLYYSLSSNMLFCSKYHLLLLIQFCIDFAF